MKKIGPESKRFMPFILIALLVGCAHTIVVTIPPRIDLQSQTIGIVEFSSNSTDKLNQYATQRFMTVIQGAQPQVRFLELGPEKELLKAVGEARMGPQAVKAIARKFGVSTLFGGTYEVSELKPNVTVQDLRTINASATVKISMAVRQWDAGTGATLWTNSRFGEWPVATVDKGAGSAVSFSLSAPEDKYEQFIARLAYGISDDFRPHYERRPAPKT